MLTAAVVKYCSVTVRDVSTSGCLLETRIPLPVGTVGMLEVTLGGRLRREPFRVCRTQRVEGAGAVHLAGLEFLRVEPADDASVRTAVAQLEVLETSGSWGAPPAISGVVTFTKLAPATPPPDNID